MAEREQPDVEFPWPLPSVPMFFWINLGQEEISASGTSYLNRTEVCLFTPAWQECSWWAAYTVCVFLGVRC